VINKEYKLLKKDNYTTDYNKYECQHVSTPVARYGYHTHDKYETKNARNLNKYENNCCLIISKKPLMMLMMREIWYFSISWETHDTKGREALT